MREAIVTARTTNDAGILLCVSDDGIGLTTTDLAATGLATPGIGMKSLHQRASILGAKLDFQSESGHGLMVRIEIQNP
jgi:signal transduction histidine kinase